MFKKFSLLLCAIALVASVSCSGSKQESAEPAVRTVDDILANAENLVDSTLTFEGVCSHLCAHGAKKMFVLGSDDSNAIRVEACDLGAFDIKSMHRPVSVTGTLREQRIDEAYLADWEERAKAAEIEDKEAGCQTERDAHDIESTTVADQIAEYRAKIAERLSKEGKPYLSFYYVDAISYEILK